MQVRDLGLRVDAGFEFDVGADAIARALPVLAGEHEQGQENRFQRYDHRQEFERVRIEGFHAPDQAEIHRDPAAQKQRVKGQRREAAGERRDGVGQAREKRPLLGRDVVDVARDGAPDHVIASAQTSRGDAQQVQRRGRTLADVGFKMLSVQTQQFDVAQGRDPGRARTAIQQRDFAEKVARLRGFEHDLLALVVLDVDLHLARADDVHRVPGVAVVEDGLAGGVAQQVDLFGQGRPFPPGSARASAPLR